MSFSIEATGRKKGVLAKLDASKGYGNTVHHDAVRDALKAIVNSIPDDQAEKTIVKVNASGHNDFPVAKPGHGNVTLTVAISPFED